MIDVDMLDIPNLHDFKYEFYQLEYCENSLDIPIHLIDYTCFEDSMLEIYLNHTNLKELQDDCDWYYNLKSLAKYSRAS